MKISQSFQVKRTLPEDLGSGKVGVLEVFAFSSSEAILHAKAKDRRLLEAALGKDKADLLMNNTEYSV
jgi:hypothetical protein